MLSVVVITVPYVKVMLGTVHCIVCGGECCATLCGDELYVLCVISEELSTIAPGFGGIWTFLPDSDLGPKFTPPDPGKVSRD